MKKSFVFVPAALTAMVLAGSLAATNAFEGGMPVSAGYSTSFFYRSKTKAQLNYRYEGNGVFSQIGLRFGVLFDEEGVAKWNSCFDSVTDGTAFYGIVLSADPKFTATRPGEIEYALETAYNSEELHEGTGEFEAVNYDGAKCFFGCHFIDEEERGQGNRGLTEFGKNMFGFDAYLDIIDPSLETSYSASGIKDLLDMRFTAVAFAYFPGAYATSLQFTSYRYGSVSSFANDYLELINQNQLDEVYRESLQCLAGYQMI